jgi:hypothetical protein
MSILPLCLFALLAVTTIAVGDIIVSGTKYRFSVNVPDGIDWKSYWKLIFASVHGPRAKVGLSLFSVGMVLLFCFVIAVFAQIRHNPQYFTFS